MFKKSLPLCSPMFLCLPVFLCLLMLCALAPQSLAGDMYLNPSAGYIIMNDSTADGNVMTVKSDGKVGIGTTAPGSRFHVQGTSIANLFRVDSSSDVLSVGGGPNSRYLMTISGAEDLAWTSAGGVSTYDIAAFLIRPASIANTSGTGDISAMTIAATSLNPTGASTWGTGLRVAVPVEGGAGSFTNMASLYVEGAPSGGTNNYAIYADGKTVLAATRRQHRHWDGGAGGKIRRLHGWCKWVG